MIKLIVLALFALIAVNAVSQNFVISLGFCNLVDGKVDLYYGPFFHQILADDGLALFLTKKQ